MDKWEYPVEDVGPRQKKTLRAGHLIGDAIPSLMATTPTSSPTTSESQTWLCPDCGVLVEPWCWLNSLHQMVYYRRSYCKCPAGVAKQRAAERQRDAERFKILEPSFEEKWLRSEALPSERAQWAQPAVRPKTWQPADFQRRADLQIRGVTPEGCRLPVEQLLSDLDNWTGRLLDKDYPYSFFWLGGTTSVGKSHLAEAALFRIRQRYGSWQQWLENPWQRAVRFIDWPVSMDLIEQSWGRTKGQRTEEERDPWGFPSEDEIWQEIAQAWCVVIDGVDIVRSGWTMFRVNNIYKMLQFREPKGLPTIFTANTDINGLKALMLTAPYKREEIIDAVIARIQRRMAQQVYIRGPKYAFAEVSA